MNLPITGQHVSRVCFDSSISLLTDSDLELKIESDMYINYPENESVAFSPEDPGDYARQIVELFQKRILRAESSQSGLLAIAFDNGVEITVEPDDDYEAWSLTSPEGMRVVCVPGGGLSTWGSTPPRAP